MEESGTASVRAQIETLLPFASEKARSFEPEISLSRCPPYLRLVAAANLFRLPRCLKVILRLVDDEVSLEANTICRTLVELAIKACWMGNDEERASLVWNKFVRDQQRGLIRFGTFTKTMAPVTKEQEREVNTIPVPPGLEICAENALQNEEFPAKSLARALYHLHYDPLSTGAHGDLRDAVTIVQWRAEAALVEKALEITLFAAVTLLCAASLQLGFHSEVKSYLSERGIATAFSESTLT